MNILHYKLGWDEVQMELLHVHSSVCPCCTIKYGWGLGNKICHTDDPTPSFYEHMHWMKINIIFIVSRFIHGPLQSMAREMGGSRHQSNCKGTLPCVGCSNKEKLTYSYTDIDKNFWQNLVGWALSYRIGGSPYERVYIVLISNM